MLPEAVMREILSRGSAANEVLLSRLEQTVQNVRGGIGSLPRESFFCFAMLRNCPDVGMLPTLERFYQLDQQTLAAAIGDLVHGFGTSLFVKMSDADNVASLTEWIESMIQNPNVYSYCQCHLASVLRCWVRDGQMSRDTAIARLKKWLQLRSNHSADMVSASIVCEFMELAAHEEKTFIESCFKRGQIDEDFIDYESCMDELSQNQTGQPIWTPKHEDEPDLIEYFRNWHCFSKASDSFDPRCTEYRDITSDIPSYRSEMPDREQIDQWFTAIRNSNDQSYPREAVQMLSRHASSLMDRLADEVRYGLSQATSDDPRSGNGPFLAATILAAEIDVTCSNELLGILDLTPDQRFEVFGDAIEAPIVSALSRSLLGDCGPIDQRVEDSSRDTLDRASLTMFYPLSVWQGYLPRQQAVHKLLQLLEQSLEAPAPLPHAIYDALCLLSVSDEEPVVRRAREFGISNAFVSENKAKCCVEHPDQADRIVKEIASEFKSPIAMIESSVMFDENALYPDRVTAKRSSQIRALATEPSKRSKMSVKAAETRVPRNSLCPCGSGTKYKKCCGKN
ncbi:SEC-C motif domain protein [Rhodopirellula maiorica SM1]|uniref:SEC-C motif domain protein n=1 Tax=Rhodopirellula maiorica SM1 TaxID=1265738 RepID=M5RKH2_9BACT|nr:SEC-C motif domain protein [Rhodopirellula maiorica SM1]